VRKKHIRLGGWEGEIPKLGKSIGWVSSAVKGATENGTAFLGRRDAELMA